MEHSDPSNPAPASVDVDVLAPSLGAARQAVLDANGFDLNDYDWIPVRRKPRVDG